VEIISGSLKKNADRKVMYQSCSAQLELDFAPMGSLNIPHKLKAIDLFAGVGGIRTGFQQAFGERIEFVFSSEIDKFARQTYAANYHEIPYGDITQIQAHEVPTHDIILAGFPCQAFSVAGLRKGFADTRGTLFFDVARIAEYHKPKILFLENVKGFKNHDKGNTFATVKLTLEQLGYRVYADVLNAKNFGVPQNRERIYIVAIRNDFNPTFNLDFDKLKNTKVNCQVGDILQNQVDEKYTISDKLWAGHQRRKAEHIEKGNGFGYSLFNAQSPYTSTISARYYKDGSEILIEQNGKNPRKLTPREASLLQGFPSDFVIPVSDVQAYKQFGNSVAVPVIKALAQEIYMGLFQNEIA